MYQNQRQEALNKILSKKVIEVFAVGIPEEHRDVLENKISYAEAVAVLQHTISVIGDEIPLAF